MAPASARQILGTYRSPGTGITLRAMRWVAVRHPPGESAMFCGSLNHWILHYNHGRVHMSLGPGIPAPLNPSPPHSEHRHRLPPGHRVRRKAVLGGLHHEYWLEKVAA